MTNQKKKPVQPVTKPFVRGSAKDEQTWKNALAFFGILLVCAFMCFLVCSMTGIDQIVIRIILNVVIEGLILMIFYNRGVSLGTEGVAKGEIAYQRQEKGRPVADSERRLCYHSLKGPLNALLGSIPVFVLAVVFAILTGPQATGTGALPSWISAYLGRTEVGDALTIYTQTPGFQFVDILRILVRVNIMPFISMVGPSNRDAVLLVERLSPILVLLPALAYSLGYPKGIQVRTRVHTEIAENRKRKARRERKARKERAARIMKPKGPQQLN